MKRQACTIRKSQIPNPESRVPDSGLSDIATRGKISFRMTTYFLK